MCLILVAILQESSEPTLATALPGPAWVLLITTYNHFSSPLYFYFGWSVGCIAAKDPGATAIQGLKNPLL